VDLIGKGSEKKEGRMIRSRSFFACVSLFLAAGLFLLIVPAESHGYGNGLPERQFGRAVVGDPDMPGPWVGTPLEKTPAHLKVTLGDPDVPTHCTDNPLERPIAPIRFGDPDLPDDYYGGTSTELLLEGLLALDPTTMAQILWGLPASFGW